MRIFAHHDSEGNIGSLVSVDGPKEAGLMMAPRAGQLVSEVEGVSIKPGEKGLAELQQIAQTHAIKKLRLAELTRKRD
jgi:hypothetical protein